MSQRWAALLALALAGCDSRLVVGENPISGSVAGGDDVPELRCPDLAAARASDEDCWPTRHVGRWRGLVSGAARYRHVLSQPLDFPGGEVLLEIEPQGTGTLLFEAARSSAASCTGGADGGLSDASAAAAGDAGSEPCRATDAGVPAAAQPGLVLDYRYALDGLSMSGAAQEERTQDPLVTFSLLIAAPWRAECVSAAPALAGTPCRCDDAGCNVSPETLQVSLSLSRDRQALRGTITSVSDPGLVAGLELVRQ